MTTSRPANPLAHRICLSCVAALLGSTAMPALAQAPSTSAAAHADDDSIVVTAQRREQRLNDTPVAVSALSSEAISDLQVRTAANLVGLVPNLSASNPGTSLQFNVRGQALIDVSDVNEAPVAVYVDNVYVAATAGQGSQLFDLERVEVLRGPQGTLFGRNASAGLIHFVSRAPTELLDGYANVQFGSYSQFIAEGAVGGSLAPGVRGRISVQRNVDGGYQKNLGSGGGRFGKTDTLSGRAQLAFDLGEDATLNLRGYGTRQRNVHPLFAYMGRLDSSGNECAPAAVLASQCMSATGYRVADPKPDRGYSEHTPDTLPDHVNLYGTDAQLNWNFGRVTLTAITAYMKLKRSLADDVDASDIGIGNYGDFNYTELFKVKARQFSQEVRLSGGEGGLYWTAGAFYFNDRRRASLSVEELAATPSDYDTMGLVRTKSWSAFGQVDYPLSPTVTVSGGLRYTSDSKRAHIDTCDQFSGCATINSGNFAIKDDNVSWRAGLEWRPNSDWLLYGTASSGYKSGEFNVTFLGGVLANANPVGAEKTYSFEIGSKGSLFDGAAQLNLALFHTTTKDKQAIATTSLSSTSLISIGDLVSYGAEAELTAKPAHWLRTSLSVGLLNTKIDAPASVTVTRNYGRVPLALDGNNFVNSPAVSINGLIRPTIHDGALGKIDLQADFHWQSKSDLDIANSPYDKQGSYGWVNLRAFWTDANDRFNASIFVENLTGTEYYARAASIGGLDFRFNVWGSKPRIFGAQFGVRF
ncbi:TonB-dependent receptor [Sphingomonas flavalba]|uniref:TonB-dependent receptor n=1 Tax=Sphingomonas flavalba TaxID=2559804 RepID=UPI00109E12E2|nr:TonB-dependent receptor [Sphingomonas flavalba]